MWETRLGRGQRYCGFQLWISNWRDLGPDFRSTQDQKVQCRDLSIARPLRHLNPKLGPKYIGLVGKASAGA